MGARVGVDCGSCGAVEVAVADVRLELSVRGTDRRNVVWFRCPRCGEESGQQVDERGTRLLSSAGVQLVMASDAATSESATPFTRFPVPPT